MSNNQVILVDKHDQELGVMEKMAAHQQGKMHRAFSIFVFNQANELLLQKRAIQKYHSGGLWTNTCCSHPQPFETVQESAERRLFEEMGIQVSLKFAFKFQYETQFENQLIENELDHVYLGFSDTSPSPDPDEVATWEYQNMDSIERDLDLHPEKYTSWFRICFPRLITYLKDSHVRN